MKIAAVGVNARYTHSCLALFYIRDTVIRKLPGTEVVIRQFTINDPRYDIVQRLADEEADYLFFSAVIWNSDLLERIIADLLEFPGGPLLVVGGPQAEVVGTRFQQAARVTVFSGAVEAAGDGFFHDLQCGSLAKRYQGHFFQQTGRRVDCPYRETDFAGPLRDRSVYYESSRGCPFSCTYCLSSAEKGLYHKDLDQVRDELTAILAHHPKTLRFVDRTFNDYPQRALAIWQFLAEHGGSTLFHFELAPDRFTEEMFDFLATIKAGCFQFEIGLQSTHLQTLNAIRRPVDPQIAAITIKRLRQLDTIRIHVDLILGLPFETADSFMRSVNDVFAMKPHYVQMGLLKILPGTEMARTAARNGYCFSPGPPYPVFANRWLKPPVLRDLYRLGECIEHFVNNRFFVSLWDYLVDTGEDMAAFFSELAELFIKRGYVFMAATQETLSSLLLEHLHDRADLKLCRELLVYDWLRCGHRLLPAHLNPDDTGEERLRHELYRQLPACCDGLYGVAERNHFIKKSVFHRFSGRTLRRIGFDFGADTGVVCFLPEREETVFRFNRPLLVDLP